MGRKKAQYGPNSAAAARFLDDLDRLPPGAVAAIAAAGGGTFGTAEDDPDVAARDEVRGRLREIARHGNRLDAVRAIGDEVADWAASTTHWFPAGVAGASDSTREMGTRLAAAPIVLDAAYAVVLEDLLADWELDLLMAPWDDVVGSPFDERRRSRGDAGDGEVALRLDPAAATGDPAAATGDPVGAADDPAGPDAGEGPSRT